MRGMWARFDWEDLLTLAIAICAVVSVAGTLEGSGWSKDMPALTLVSVLALPAALALARSRLPVYAAWPLSVLLGAIIVFWQTLVMVGPGSILDRLDAVYWRFERWFGLAFGAPGVNNDPLPFNVFVLGLTWLGVFLFGWSVFRWNNAWPGLIPGGVALFLDLVFVGDALTTASILYVLFGFLLLMRTNLTSRLARWRAEGTPYPPLISFTFLNFSLWSLLALIIVGWLSPTGPFSTPPPIKAMTSSVEGFAIDIVRLAGPLHVKKVTPVHNYTGLLPFQGSVKLGERELLSVQVGDRTLQGPFALRGAVYDTYSSGGWQNGVRQRTPLPNRAESLLRKQLANGEVSGMLVPMTVQVRAKSVVGTVIFSPGQPVSAERYLTADMVGASIRWRTAAQLGVPGEGAELSDSQVLNQLPDDLIGLGVDRDARNRVSLVQVIDLSEQPLPDALSLHPGSRVRKGEMYKVLGFVNMATADTLREAERSYPQWAKDLYLQLPEGLTDDVRQLARDIAGGERNAYDKAKAIEGYLRGYPVDYKIKETPPGRDTVQYFLFDARRGYFDYHASAMVVMLRAQGVPARLAVGFAVDEADRDEETGSYLVRDRNSYTWTEVYFPGYGWIPFNPSPDRPANLVPRLRTDIPLGAGGVGADEFPDLPIDGADRVLTPLPEDAMPARGSSGGAGGEYAPWALLAVLAFGAAMVFAVKTGWQRSVAGLPYSQQLWEKTVRLASWAGYPPERGQTPQEYARRIEQSLWGVRDVGLLAAVYSRSRFGRRDAEPEERERLEQMWPRLRSAALSAMLRRIRRRRPEEPQNLRT